MRTKQKRTEMCRAVLAQEGLFPKVDPDGDIEFDSKGVKYLLLIDDDEAYFRIVSPGFWTIHTDKERTKAMYAALEASAETKVAKVLCIRDEMTAAFEMFCPHPIAFRTVFLRGLGELQSAVRSFRGKME